MGRAISASARLLRWGLHSSNQTFSWSASPVLSEQVRRTGIKNSFSPPSPRQNASGRSDISGHHDDLADDFTVLDETQTFRRLIEGQNLIDDRLEFLLNDHLHEVGQVFLIEAVRADHLQFEAPYIAQILLRIMSRGGAAYQQASASLEAAQRRHPGVATGEIDHDIDPTFIGAPLRLAIFLDGPFRKVDFLVVDRLVGTHRLELFHLLGAAGARNHFGAEQLAQDHAAGADPAAGAQDKDPVALADGVVGNQHAV